LHLKLLKHSRSLTAANEFYSIFKWPNYGEAYKWTQTLSLTRTFS
jgi:hypothetical protein